MNDRERGTVGLDVHVAAQLGVPHVALSRVANGRAAISLKWLRE